MQRRSLVILGIFLFLGILFLMGIAAVVTALRTNEGFEDGNVALIEVSGEIISAVDVVEEIRDVLDKEELKAAILRVESPGGSVAASQEILEAIEKLKEKKPVVASFGNVAASGGYYIGLGANKIFAAPGTITGSIGVRVEHLQVRELMDWAKLKHETLKSGKYKDIISPFRDITEEERELIHGMLASIHEQFKMAIVDRRGLKKEAVDELADGRVFTGEEAKKLGLVDEIGGLTKALEEAGRLSGIEKPKLAKKKARGRLGDLFDVIGDMKGILSKLEGVYPK